MKANIFENAYFGKPYKTRKGEKAIYLFSVGCGVYCVTEEFKNKIRYFHFNGIPYDFEFSKYRGEDIISEWDEEINEDTLQALQAKCLAEDIENGVMKRDMDHYYPHDEQSWIQGYAVGFDKGFKKAKEK